MNRSQATGGRHQGVVPSFRRVARVAAIGMAVAGAGLLIHEAVVGASLEIVLVALGLVAGGALVGLLALGPGGAGTSVVHDDHRSPRSPRLSR